MKKWERGRSLMEEGGKKEVQLETKSRDAKEG